MKLLGQIYAVPSSFSYDFIYDLPNKTDNMKPAELRRCNMAADGGNETMETKMIKCTIGILTIRLVLRNYSLLIYDEVQSKIEQIFRMIPPEFEIPRRSNRGLVDGLGKLLRYVAGIATVDDNKKMHGRLFMLENYILDNQQGTRMELGRLPVADNYCRVGWF